MRRLCRAGLAAVLVAVTGFAGAPAQSGSARSVLLDPEHEAFEILAPERFRVRFETTEGDVTVEFFRRWSPHGVDRVYDLVRLGFYDDSRIHRVRDGVFAQFGLAGDPAVDATWYERTIPDDPRVRPNRRGVVSFAMLEEPDSRTTQLFINLRDNPAFDEQGFMPVGRIVDGMDVVDRFHSDYGEEAGGGMRAGNQGRILAEGNAHLDREFPLLTRILDASVLPGEVLRYPYPGGNSIRAELHMYPAVSTGPLDPTWSTDGSRIAFSMAGDLWVIDAAGGVATALTAGPASYFEPSWSPDGERIAFSRDLDGNLDIGVVPSAGGAVRMLTDHPHVDLQPAWGADSESLYWVSARDGDFDIFRLRVDEPDAEPLAVVGGPGHQVQPAISPDGGTLAFVSRVEGRLGNGGLWTLQLGQGNGLAREALDRARLVHYEEMAFRAEPAWSTDGRSLLFVSDDAGSDDLAVVPARGGSRARLTQAPSGELDPAPSPDGERIAFVANRGGPTRLYTAPIGGARRAGWSPVPIEAREHGRPTAYLEVTVVGSDGQPAPSRLHVLGPDGRGYAPEGGFHRVISATDLPYFHTGGESRLELPAGRVEIEARRGPEFLPARRVLELEPGAVRRVTLAPERLIDMPAAGWVSGDTHSHDLHSGRYGLDHEDYFRQLVAEDLRITNALIHMDGTRLMGRWEDLTGEPHPLSTATHVLQYGQEFRGSFGHVGLLGISEFVMPLIGGTGATVFAAPALNADWLDAAREQGGIGGYMHPFSRNQDPASSEIVIDVALGKGDFFDVANYPYDDLHNARMYWRFLNAGFRMAATGGSDNFADVWRDAPPGASRTYADTGGRIDVPAWLEAVRAGKTFATSGPLLLFRLSPAGGDGRPIAGHSAGPGQELSLGPELGSTVVATVEVASVAPLDRVDFLVNGEIVRSIDARALGRRFVLEEAIDLPGSGWVAVVAVGPAARAVTDGYPFAHTTPVWAVRGGEPFVDLEAAAELAGLARAFGQRVESRGGFDTEQERSRFLSVVQRAVEIYERIAVTGERR